jgi:hypothetical protein
MLLGDSLTAQGEGRRPLHDRLVAEGFAFKGAPPFNKPGGDYADGTHLNASGGKKLADGWFAHLKPSLIKP